MVFKNGELLRTYYFRMNFDEDSDGVWVDILFTDFRDKNGQAPATPQSGLGGGEIYEFKEMDFLFSDINNDRDIQFFKRNAFGIDHEIFILVGDNNMYIHYDRTDLNTSIDRSFVTNNNVQDNRGNNSQIDPENWLLSIYQDGPGDVLTGTLEITLVVRVH